MTQNTRRQEFAKQTPKTKTQSVFVNSSLPHRRLSFPLLLVIALVFALTSCENPAGYEGPEETIYTITSTRDWNNALVTISSDSDGTFLNPKVYTLNIQGTVSVPGVVSGGESITGNIKTVRLTGSGTLSLLNNGSIFRIARNTQTLIIDGPTLRGRTGNSAAVVTVSNMGIVELRNGTISGNSGECGVNVFNYGTFTMSGGTITGNTVTSYTGGVFVDGNGTFTMSGGTINNNTATDGGGVYVRNGGTFTMSGGTISDNTVDNGGGVFTANNGTFTMSGGTISGNTAHEEGGGVFVRDSGTFTKTGGTIYGDNDDVPDNGNAADNTATRTDNPGQNGHAVFYNRDNSYYCNETLEDDDPSGNISTTDELPEAGQTKGNWTQR